MRTLLFTSALLLFTIAAMGQKVKEKGDIYFVDDSAFVKKGCKKIITDACPFSTANGDQGIFAIVAYPYTKIITVQEGYTTVEKTLPAYYYMIQFSLVMKDFTTLKDPKDIIRDMYNSGFILPNGSVDPDLLTIFIQQHNEQPPTPGNTTPGLINDRW